jgi:hypothetical protein
MNKKQTAASGRKQRPKHPGGRPKIDDAERKATTVRARVTAHEHDLLEAAAHREHLELSTWIRRALLLAAEATDKKK